MASQYIEDNTVQMRFYGSALGDECSGTFKFNMKEICSGEGHSRLQVFMSADRESASFLLSNFNFVLHHFGPVTQDINQLIIFNMHLHLCDCKHR